MDPAAAIARLWELAPALLLALCRLGALFFTAPLLGGPFVPVRVKVWLTLAIAVVALPTLAPHLPAALPSDGRYLLLIAAELAIGAAIGFSASCVFEGVRTGGELINRYAGFTAAENFDPESGIGEGPIGDLLMVGMVLIFLVADAHLYLIAALAMSYAAVPLGAFVVGPAVLQTAALASDQCLALAAAISFPVLTVVLLITVAEGVLTKAVPQINVLFISFAVKILASLLVLYAAMPAIVGFMGQAVLIVRRLSEAMLLAL
ncbi:MAG: flagellar biosynthetic protein FliR [Planctomycetota bacterium]|nr:flagellar biosynthetic protein FliR [Planctomycetota bacterium]MCX8039053.1 flagellar biosynthetic protein FliR [Planctomycetota bacterium]MDW8372703.1 flagellar biosynthetic protein FliR [Planctomycetota bacterium]